MIFVLLPAFNEQESLSLLLTSLNEVLSQSEEKFRVILVNDGSTDETEKIAKKFQKILNLKIINHKKNLGLGKALESGILSFLKEGKKEDILITMDADNTHPPKLIPKLLEQLRQGSDVVIASRFTKGSRISGLGIDRKIFSIAASLLFRVALPMKGVKDYTSGFRIYRIGILNNARHYYSENFITQDNFSSMAEILIKLRRFNPKVSEIPLSLRYDLKKGKSKMKILLTVMGIFSLVSSERKINQSKQHE